MLQSCCENPTHIPIKSWVIIVLIYFLGIRIPGMSWFRVSRAAVRGSAPGAEFNFSRRPVVHVFNAQTLRPQLETVCYLLLQQRLFSLSAE